MLFTRTEPRRARAPTLAAEGCSTQIRADRESAGIHSGFRHIDTEIQVLQHYSRASARRGSQTGSQLVGTKWACGNVYATTQHHFDLTSPSLQTE